MYESLGANLTQTITEFLNLQKLQLTTQSLPKPVFQDLVRDGGGAHGVLSLPEELLTVSSN